MPRITTTSEVTTMLNMQVCNHGYYMWKCPLCEKRPGECDYGSCTEPATATVETIALATSTASGHEL